MANSTAKCASHVGIELECNRVFEQYRCFHNVTLYFAAVCIINAVVEVNNVKRVVWHGPAANQCDGRVSTLAYVAPVTAKRID